MFTTPTHHFVLMALPPELSGRPGLIYEGTLIKDAATGQVAGQMVEVTRLPSALLQTVGSLASVLNLGVSVVSFTYMRSQFNALNYRLNQIERKIDVVDPRLDMLLGMVQRVDAKVDTLTLALSSLTGKIDGHHRDDVFAEIGAVLDTLGYADRKTPQEASTLVANNITPARKAIRRFERLIEEYEAALTEGDLALIETMRMHFMLGLLSVKIDLALGETQAALDQALQVAQTIKQRGKAFLHDLLASKPLAVLGRDMEAGQLVRLCNQMEIIDGTAAAQRLAQTLTVAEAHGNAPEIAIPEHHHMRFYLGLHETSTPKLSILQHGNGPFLETPGLISSNNKHYWNIEDPIRKNSGEVVSKGETLASIKIMKHDWGSSAEVLCTVDLLSPVDGIFIEDFSEDIRKARTPRKGLSHIKPTSNKPFCSIAHYATPASIEQPRKTHTSSASGLVDGIENLSRIAAAASGIALETVLLKDSHKAAALREHLLGKPFMQDCIVIPAIGTREPSLA